MGRTGTTTRPTSTETRTAGASIGPTMVIELPVVLVIATAALLVALIVAQRAGAHAERTTGRAPVPHVTGRSPLGSVVDRLDGSSAAAALRSRLGRSTATRAESRAVRRRATLESLMTRPDGDVVPQPTRPARLVVAGGPRQAVRAPALAPMSSVSVELVAGALGVVVIAAVLIGIWPRETGGVLSATGTPGATPTLSPSPSPEVSGT